VLWIIFTLKKGDKQFITFHNENFPKLHCSETVIRTVKILEAKTGRTRVRTSWSETRIQNFGGETSWKMTT